YWVIPENGQFALANDDLCNCDMSEVRLILPAVDLTNFVATSISAEVWSNQVYSLEENSLEVSLDNGATWTTVGATFPATAAWQPITYSLADYDGMSNVLIAFRHNDIGEWGQGLAVNDVSVEGIAVGGDCFFEEDFEGVTAPDLPMMWTSTNPNGGDLFITGDAAAANAGGYWVIPENGQFALANDDLCNCDMSEVRLILPSQDFSGVTNASIDAQIWSNQVYSLEENSLEVSLDDGATWTTVGDIFPAANAWQDITYDLSAYDGMSNVLIAFRHNDIGEWGQGLAVNDICIYSAPDNLVNAAIQSASRLNAEYTIVPVSQETPTLISAEVANLGNSDLTNLVLTSSLFEESDPMNPVQVVSSSPITLAPGASMVIDNNPMAETLGAIGRYYVEHIVSHDNSAEEFNTENDTIVTPIFEISDALYARNDTSSTDLGAFGIGTGGGANAMIGQNFEMLSAGAVTSVEVVIDGNEAGVNGEPVSVAVYACDANGIPQAPALATTEVQFGTDVTMDETFVLNFETSINLAAGIYFFGVLEEGSGNIRLKGYADIYTPGDNTQGTNWVAWDSNPDGAGVFTEPTTISPAFAAAYHIRPMLGEESCFSGALAGGGAVASVCGDAATFNFATDGTEQIPAAGGYRWQFTPGVNAGGGDPAGFVNDNSPTNVDWDAGLNGILAGNGLEPLTGTWSVTGFVYADANDIEGSICGSATGAFELTFSPDIIQDAAVTDASTNSSMDGSIDLTVTGGVEPYTYAWSNGETVEDLESLPFGEYAVMVTDAAGCESSSMWTVDAVVGIEGVTGLQSLNIFPNPADHQVFIQLELEQAKQVVLDVFSVTGQRLVSFEAGQITQRQYELNTSEFQAGIYLARFTIDGEVVTKRFTIAR
ncbi:MAG: T9SS type A sorting domain-containing protein, partial [Bacteroidota bacterium]